MADWRDQHTGGIAWRERPGAGPVLVCLHGIGSRAAGWQALATHLPGWRLIAWDAPGYGASAPLAQDWPVARDYAAALERLTNALELSDFHCVGHSLGTLIAASYARNYPQALKSLTLVSCAQGGGVSPGETLASRHQARIDDLQALGPVEFSKSRAPRLIHAPETRPDLAAEATRAMAAVNPDGYAQAAHMLASGDLKASAVQTDCPTLVLTGTEDVITPPAQSRMVHDAMLAATPAQAHAYAEVPGCGHLVHAEDPEAVARHLTAFVAALDRKGNAA